MKLFSNLKNKTIRTGKRLFAYDQLHQGFHDQASVIKDLVKNNIEEVKPDQPKIYIETQKVEEAQRSFKKILVIFIGLFFAGILYCIASLINKHWVLALLALAFCMLCLSFAFRYHFWLYQIKKRKLGLKFSDYYKDEIEGPLGVRKKPVVKKDKQ